MIKKSIRRFLLLLTAVLIMSLPLSARADTGPKPTVRIRFVNTPEAEFTVTMLTAGDTLNDVVDYPSIFNRVQTCSEKKDFNIGYMAPQRFCLAFYFPESDRTVVSDTVYERYAFNASYTADLSGILETGSFVLKSHALIKSEIISLILRILLTLGIELAIAVWYGIRSKKAVTVIIVTNILTQILLNLFLRRTYAVHTGMWGWVMLIPLEIVILLFEILIYVVLLKKEEGQTKGELAGYAVLANLCSFIVGVVLSYLMD